MQTISNGAVISDTLSLSTPFTLTALAINVEAVAGPGSPSTLYAADPVTYPPLPVTASAQTTAGVTAYEVLFSWTAHGLTAGVTYALSAVWTDDTGATLTAALGTYDAIDLGTSTASVPAASLPVTVLRGAPLYLVLSDLTPVTLTDATFTAFGVTTPAIVSLNILEYVVAQDAPIGLTTGVWDWLENGIPQSQAIAFDVQPNPSQQSYPTDGLSPVQSILQIWGADPVSVAPWPTVALAFSDPPSPSLLTSPGPLSLWRAPLLDYRGRLPVQGTWAVATSVVPELGAPAANTLVFSPAEPLRVNCRYAIALTQGTARASDGATLAAPFVTTWLSTLTPFYVDPYAVLQRLGEFAGRVSEEDLSYTIWKASMTCNRETMPFVPILPGGPRTQDVVRAYFPRTYAMDMFVELETVSQLLQKLIVSTNAEVGRRTQGLDFSTEADESLLDNLKKALTMVRSEREVYYAEISRHRARSRSVVKSQDFWPGRGARDLSFHRRHGF